MLPRLAAAVCELMRSRIVHSEGGDSQSVPLQDAAPRDLLAEYAAEFGSTALEEELPTPKNITLAFET